MPVVRLSAQGVFLNGEFVGAAVSGMARIALLEQGLESLKRSGEAQPPSYLLLVAEDVPVGDVMRALHTSSVAGWGRARLGGPASTVEMGSLVPSSGSNFDGFDTSWRLPRSTLLVQAVTDGVALWRVPRSEEDGQSRILGESAGQASELAGLVRAECADTATCRVVTLAGEPAASFGPAERALRLVAEQIGATSSNPLKVVPLVGDEGVPKQFTKALSGRLPPEAVRSVVRQSHPAFRSCYEQGLGRDPELQGKVRVRFVIGTEGYVIQVEVTEPTTLPDPLVVDCVAEVYRTLRFPKPDGGNVTVNYPLHFQPN